MIFADSKLGKIKVFTFFPANFEKGNFSFNISGFKAKSAWSSPSITISGWFLCKYATASLTFAAPSLVDDPKLENDIIAITGSTPNILAVFAVIMAILAKSSADGLILMAVSDKNIGPRDVIIMFVVATIEAPCAFSISCNIGLTTDG